MTQEQQIYIFFWGIIDENQHWDRGGVSSAFFIWEVCNIKIFLSS